MKKKSSPILQKLSNLLNVPIFVAKMRKPIIGNSKLLLLKKSRQLKRFKLLNNKHCKYNYRFLEEYEFSASSTRLIHHHRKHYLKKNRSLENICSMLFLCTCFGGLKTKQAGEAGDNYSSAIESLPAITMEPQPEPVLGLDLEDEEDDSVDQRAERFIQWFYQEMRLQRQDSC